MTDLDLGDLEPRPGDGSHLTDSQVRAIEAYMVAVLRALDLGHWRVYVAQDLPPEDARLMIYPTDGRRIAMLYVAETWWDSTAAVKRVDLTHEALHLAHHDVDANMRRFFNGSGDISDYVRSLIVDQFKTDLERMVDSLSYVIAPFMPEWDETGNGTGPETIRDPIQNGTEPDPKPNRTGIESKSEPNPNRNENRTEPDSDRSQIEPRPERIHIEIEPEPDRSETRTGSEPDRTRTDSKPGSDPNPKPD